ncbi:MAG TPA: ABC transporter ATP-binding protein [Streptosporangiaceae bacterium]|nr:ABC transporter ATP-binding protein [Streptosporangiaceae bacterium]
MRLEAVGKRYGLRQPWIVRNVSQDVAAGQLIKLEGPNGSGKSTLLKMMAGVSTPSAGRLTARPHTGYVPERFPGALGFGAREYLQHMARIHGLAGAASGAAVDDWLERLGATEYARAPLRTLSKGMCQKVAIAQALLSRPGLLVLDEAWTGLDQAARGVLDAAVVERLAGGGIVLFVDHDPARLAGLVNERWRLAGGTVTVVAGGGQAVETPARETVIIELAGLEAGSLPRLAEVDGIREVHGDSGAADHQQQAPRLVTLTVDPASSDTVLRDLLTWDGVHVTRVWPAARGRQPGGPGRGSPDSGREGRGDHGPDSPELGSQGRRSLEAGSHEPGSQRRGRPEPGLAGDS